MERDGFRHARALPTRWALTIPVRFAVVHGCGGLAASAAGPHTPSKPAGDRERAADRFVLRARDSGEAIGHKLKRQREMGGIVLDRTFALIGALMGFLAVAAGAFGAHAFRARLTPEDLAIFETAARYQMYHALALLGVAWAWTRSPGAATASGWLFVVGTLVFSGSLYVLVLSGARWLGAVTPLGGLALLAGWLALAWAVARGA